MQKVTKGLKQAPDTTAVDSAKRKPGAASGKKQLIGPPSGTKWPEFSEPNNRINEICRRFEQIRSKNLECVKTLNKFNQRLEGTRQRPAQKPRPATSAKPTRKKAQRAVNSAEIDASTRKKDFAAANQKLKELLFKRKSQPASFNELRKKVRSLSVSSNINVSELSMDIERMDRNQLVELQQAINSRLQSFGGGSSVQRKSSDTDSFREIGLVEEPYALFESKYLESKQTNPYLKAVQPRAIIRSKKEQEHNGLQHLRRVYNENILSTSASEAEIQLYISRHLPNQPAPQFAKSSRKPSKA
jgi:hypothetical protein